MFSVKFFAILTFLLFFYYLYHSIDDPVRGRVRTVGGRHGYVRHTVRGLRRRNG